MERAQCQVGGNVLAEKECGGGLSSYAFCLMNHQCFLCTALISLRNVLPKLDSFCQQGQCVEMVLADRSCNTKWIAYSTGMVSHTL